MRDNYTKMVLTVIALSLVVLSIQQIVKPAAAQFGQCGLQRDLPCYITIIPEAGH
jgi:hypothetical protein